MTLLVSKHEYWRNVEFKKYEKYFSRTIWYERIDFSPPTIPFIKQIIISGLLFFQLIILKIKVRKLGINKKDIIIGLSASQLLENVVISSFPGCRKISVVQEAAIKEEKICKRLLKNGKLVYTINGFLFKIYCPILKLRKTYHLLKRGTKNVYDGAVFQIYEKGFKNEYNKILIMLNITSQLPYTNIGQTSLRNTYFPYFQMTTKRKKNKIIFFGMPYISGMCVNRMFYIKKMNQYLDFLRRIYGKNYKLEYRPHPQDMNDFEDLNLSRFTVARDRTIAELYLLEESSKIKAVYSVCSTSSRSALNFQINSYVYPKLFPLKNDAKEYYNDLFGSVPGDFVLDNLKIKPKSIVFRSVNSSKSLFFMRDLDWAIS